MSTRSDSLLAVSAVTAQIKAGMADHYLKDLTAYAEGDKERFSRQVDGRGSGVTSLGNCLHALSSICANPVVTNVFPDFPNIISERLADLGMKLPALTDAALDRPEKTWPSSSHVLAVRFWNEQYRNGVRIDACKGQLVFQPSIADPTMRVQEFGLLKFPHGLVEPDPLLEFELSMIDQEALLDVLDHKGCPDELTPCLNHIISEREYYALDKLAAEKDVLIGAQVAPYGRRTYFVANNRKMLVKNGK